MLGRLTWVLLHALATCAGIVALVVAFAAWRLPQGPVSLAFLAPQLERMFAAARPDHEISFGDLVLSIGGGLPVAVRVSDVRARRLDDMAAAHVPETRIALDASALLQGKVQPQDIHLTAPSLSMTSVSEAGAREGGDPLRPLVQAFSNNPILSALRSVTIVDGGLTVMRTDSLPAHVWSAPLLVLEHHGAEISTRGSLAVVRAGEGAAFDAAARYDLRTASGRFKVEFAGLEPAALARIFPEFTAGEDFNLPISGRVEAAAAAGGIESVRFDLSSGAGSFISPILYAPGTRLAVAGIAASGHFDGAASRLVLDRFLLDFDGPTVAAAGSVGGDWSRPDIALDIDVRAVPVDVMRILWPHKVLPASRGWTLEKMSGGILEELILRLVIPAEAWDSEVLAADMVQGDLALSDATFRYHDDLPPLRDIQAEARFDAVSFEANVFRGISGPFQVNNATVDIGEADGVDRVLVAAPFASEVGAGLAVFDRPSFPFMHSAGLDAARLSGSARGELTLYIPLDEAAGADATRTSITAQLTDVAAEPGALGGALGERVLGDGAFSLYLDDDGLEIVGVASIDDVSSEIRLSQMFSAPQPAAARRVDVTARLDAAARERFGLDLEWLSGVVDARLRVVEGEDGLQHVDAVFDAAGAETDIPVLSWQKAHGAPGTLRAAVMLGAEGIEEIPRFELVALGCDAAGAARRASGRTWTIHVDHLACGPNDVTGMVTIDSAEGTAISVSGRRFDLRNVRDRVEEEEESSFSRAFSVSAEIDELVLDDDLSLRDVTARLTSDGTQIDSVDVEGVLDGGAPVVVRLRAAPEIGGRRLHIASDDAGRFLAALDMTPNMVGGELVLDAVIDDRAEEPVSGILTVRDFGMVDAPVLAQMLSLVSVTGALELLADEGLVFDHLHAPLTYRDSVLTVDQAYAVGLSLGMTMNGVVDLNRDELDIRGTLAPLYVLNSFVNAIPMFGELLTGGRGKGVFAAPYRVVGPRADPAVSVNPLAALAPGFLREMLLEGARQAER